MSYPQWSAGSSSGGGGGSSSSEGRARVVKKPSAPKVKNAIPSTRTSDHSGLSPGAMVRASVTRR